MGDYGEDGYGGKQYFLCSISSFYQDGVRFTADDGVGVRVPPDHNLLRQCSAHNLCSQTVVKSPQADRDYRVIQANYSAIKIFALMNYLQPNKMR